MATVSKLRVHPVKSLEAVDLDRVSIVGTGQFEFDRAFAMFDEEGDYFNARNDQRVHRLRSSFDTETNELLIGTDGTDERHRFDLESETDRDALETWLSESFGQPISIQRAQETNYNDSAGGLAPTKLNASGPTIVSVETYQEVASWFPDLSVEDLRRRFRTNIEVEGVEPFWEDRLFSQGERAVEFDIGETTLYGVMPKPRCAVPTRDPDTGEPDRGFIKRFAAEREQRFPSWADADHLGQHIDLDVEHYYYLSVVTRIPRSAVGNQLRVGDEVTIKGELPVIQTL